MCYSFEGMSTVPSENPVVCVIGASGFIGRHLVSALTAADVDFRFLTRQATVDGSLATRSYTGDLFVPSSLVSFLAGADVLINLAQPASSGDGERFLEGMNNLAAAVESAGVRRVIHVSTAMVVGVPETDRITELSECNPMTVYERQKLSAETVLRNKLAGRVDLGILRPTAVFGVGGKNLIKLIDNLKKRVFFYRNVLRFIHGARHMHLVSARDVVDAIVFLAFLPKMLEGNVFLVSSDDEPSNNYQAVDAIVGAAMGKPMPLSSISIPGALLGLLLRVAGRSQSSPRLIYDASKIRSWGFQPKGDFTSSLEAFAKAYMKNGDQ